MDYIFLQALVNGILLGGLYILLAIGLNLVTGVLKVINFAHGDLVMLGMYIVYWVTVIFNINPLLALPLSFAALAVVGIAAYLVILSPVLRSTDLEQLLITVAFSLFLQGLAQVLWKSDYRLLKLSPESINIGTISISQTMLIVFLISLIASILLYIFLMRTHIGIKVRAVVQDPEMASLCGINVRKIHYLVVALGFGLAALAGGLLVLMFPAYPTAGLIYGLIAWIIMVIGGLGSVLGAFLGGMFIGIIEVLAAIFWNIELARAIAFAIFIIVIALKPTGILGARARV